MSSFDDYGSGNDASSGGSFLEEPGLYHFVVADINTQPTNKDGVAIKNAACKVTLQVLAGSVPGQDNKLTSETFFWPKPDGNDGGKFAQKKLDRFLIAVGLLDPTMIGSGKKSKINIMDAVNRQLLMKIEKEKDDSKYVQMAYADVFHVDDPDASGYPKNEEALKMIPANLRGANKAAPKTEKPAAPPVDTDAEPF